MTRAGDRYAARLDAGRDNDFVEALCQQHLDGGRCVESDRHVRVFEFTLVVPDRLAVLRFAWNAPGQVELSTDRGLTFEQRHLMTPVAGERAEGHARRPGSHHADAFGPARTSDVERQLMACAWIHQARG